MLALKRAQNWLGSVLVPLSNLGQKSPTADPLYATQIAFLKDQTGGRALGGPYARALSWPVPAEVASRWALRWPVGAEVAAWWALRWPAGGH